MLADGLACAREDESTMESNIHVDHGMSGWFEEQLEKLGCPHDPTNCPDCLPLDGAKEEPGICHQLCPANVGLVAQQFWNKVDMSDMDKCWPWLGAVFYTVGYGRFYLNGKNVLSHRVAYELAYGSIPDGMCVCHTCDNRLCQNPDHLFAGTLNDNNQDMMRKGRHRHGVLVGEKNPRARLSQTDVSAIRAAYQGERGQMAQLAREYGMCLSQIANIVHGRSWQGSPCPFTPRHRPAPDLAAMDPFAPEEELASGTTA